jgi:ABC-type uncharacterized transport system substrate-binding protein
MRRRDFMAGLGSAAVCPLTARAQDRIVPVIGYLTNITERMDRQYLAAFRRGLGEQGYAEGRNVELLYRSAETQYERLQALAEDLTHHRVAAIAATGGAAAALAVKSATATIPVVFAFGSDPVELGLVTSLSRPGGNITGVTILTLGLLAKRFELLHEIVPATTSIGYLVNPAASDFDAQVKEADTAARRLGLQLTTFRAKTSSEIESAFASLSAQHIGALLVGSDALFNDQRNLLAQLAARHALPAIFPVREIVEAGGLMSYAASLDDAWRLAGSYVGRILKGERPSDLPVQQSSRVEMVLNLKTAKALGLEIPSKVLALADEVIE